MNNFSALLLGMLALYVLLFFTALFLWRSGILFMALNVIADYLAKIRRAALSRRGRS